MRTKRPYTRAEKSLFAAPLLILALALAGWLWQQRGPVTIEVPDVTTITALRFSPDSSRLLVQFGDFVGQPLAGKVFDVTTREKVCDLPAPRLLGSDFYFSEPSWSGDGTRIVAGYDDGSRGPVRVPGTLMEGTDQLAHNGVHFNKIAHIAVWDAQSGNLSGNFFYAPVTEDARYTSLRFSSDGKRLLGEGAPPSIFDAATGKRLFTSKGTFAATSFCAINEKLGLMAIQDGGGKRLQIVDLKSKRVVWDVHSGAVHSVKWQGNVLGAIQSDALRSRLLLWDGKKREALPTPLNTKVQRLFFRPDARTLAFFHYKNRSGPSTPDDSELVIWDYKECRTLSRHLLDDSGYSCEFSPDGKWLAIVTPGDETTLQVYDLTGTLRIQRDIMNFAIAWSPDSKNLAIIPDSSDNRIRVELVPVGN